jgi:Ca2+-binding RTX toxin-like protein
MSQFSGEESDQMMGIGAPGEMRQGADGNLYQWIQGIDGLGNPVGFWVGQELAPAVPAPYQVQGVEGDDDLQGLEGDDELQGFGGDELTQIMGIGSLGEVRPGPDGNLYQWVQGIDGLGNPVGFWRRLRKGLRKVVRRAMPLVQQVAPFIPALAPAAAALRVATPMLRQAGVAGDGLGAIYQAPAGELYQVQGLEGDDELQGLEGDDELQGLEGDDDLQGFEGYVREAGSQFGAYVPQRPPSNRWFTPPAQPPEMWRPMW